MDAQASGWPLVCDVLRDFQEGNVVSVKATIAMVRKREPHLLESDCHLVEIIVDVAPKRGMFVAFDVREA
ncbi:hypothetical protein FJ976_03650 [Mesorhizobium sp. B1-1-9]|nr:hypothetical protein FJ978_01560 [Mesorhizobium sp. B1-1-7]TPN57733.1 hypothetical protein FJ976_03650 [Mesorhizobium sp. B1-1-9]